LGICRCMAAKSIEKVYLGRNDGLYVLNLTDTGFVLTSLATVHPGFSDRITSLNIFKNGLVVGTQKSGVLIYSASEITHITTNEGLNTNHVTNTYIDQYNNIWVASNEGINIIDGNY